MLFYTNLHVLMYNQKVNIIKFNLDNNTDTRSFIGLSHLYGKNKLYKYIINNIKYILK